VQMFNLTQEPSERTDLACTELLQTARASGDPASIVISGLTVGFAAASARRWAAAAEHFEAALGVARELGRVNLQCNALGGLSEVLKGRGQLEEAQAMLEASLTLRRSIGHDHNIAVDLIQLANLTITRNDSACANAQLCESVPLIRATGSAWLEAALVRAVARLLARQGQWAASVELHAAAAERRRDHGTAPSTDELCNIQADLDAAEAALGEITYMKAWATGAALDHADAFQLAVRRLGSPPEHIIPDRT
jgi:tetratricopeptide (TPR) repeat protein